ncbi:HDOD domain-containing protein [Litoribrevibacter euphylliae]|uniref:HDOD domain-containing protein n=1 Tax=Litoribrevibacter euphylliae TaxID=1834034 RepID=A0ABV7HEW5_9GAMM
MELADIFNSSQQLPSIPKVVQELIESFKDEESIDIDDIADKISKDQVLSAKVLRIANSAKFSSSREVKTINDAVVLLGLSMLRTMVLASGISAAVTVPQGFDRKGFWKDSFAVAELSRWIARYTNVNPESAFTAGMLYSIGIVLMHTVYPQECVGVDAMIKEGKDRREAEHQVFGYDYAEVGAELARRWRFPNEMSDGIAHHYDPLANDPVPPMAGIINLALFLHQAHMDELSEDEIIARFPSQIADAVGMDHPRALQEVQDAVGVEEALDALLEGL